MSVERGVMRASEDTDMFNTLRCKYVRLLSLSVKHFP